jgi:hypothetical protein
MNLPNQKEKMSPMCTGCIMLNATVPHTHIKLEAFLNCGPQPDVLYNLLLTVWFTKLKQMFVVLQPGMPPNDYLLQVGVRIIDDATCNVSYSGAFTDRMICAYDAPGYKGPCDVRSL